MSYLTTSAQKRQAVLVIFTAFLSHFPEVLVGVSLGGPMIVNHQGNDEQRGIGDCKAQAPIQPGSGSLETRGDQRPRIRGSWGLVEGISNKGIDL